MRAVRRWGLLGTAFLIGVGGAAWTLYRPAHGADRALAARWGVDQLVVRSTAAGNLLDFRYRVIDPAKAAALHGRDSKPYLVDLKSGRRLPVPSTPKAGALWNHGAVKAGRSYFALFSNPGKLVRSGDRVSIVIDGFAARDLVVQ